VLTSRAHSFIYQGGPCSIVAGLPISTVAGRAAAIEYCARQHAMPQGMPGTAIGNAYAGILQSWVRLLVFFFGLCSSGVRTV
jgi:hypothetical protein